MLKYDIRIDILPSKNKGYGSDALNCLQRALRTYTNQPSLGIEIILQTLTDRESVRFPANLLKYWQETHFNPNNLNVINDFVDAIQKCKIETKARYFTSLYIPWYTTTLNYLFRDDVKVDESKLDSWRWITIEDANSLIYDAILINVQQGWVNDTSKLDVWFSMTNVQHEPLILEWISELGQRYILIDSGL